MKRPSDCVIDRMWQNLQEWSSAKKTSCMIEYTQTAKFQGPVVQSVLSLTSSLRVISLTVLADSLHNILIFFAEKMWVASEQKISGRYLDSAGILTRWLWPIFCAPVHFTHFTLTFNISSTIRLTTTKPCILLLLIVRTLQVPWYGDLDLYFTLHWLLHILCCPSICPQL